MKLRISTGPIAIICVLLAACQPYPENTPLKSVTPPTQPQTTKEQPKVKEQAAPRKKPAEETRKTTQTPTDSTRDTTPGTSSSPQTTTPPAEPKRVDYAFANKVPGKEGFVFSPYNNKVVDVRDIPSGTLVQDPTYPASEKKYFRVP